MTLRSVAIVGAGIGAAHLAAYLTLPERFRVAAICDPDARRAQALLDRVPDARYAPDLDAVLADASPEIVDICLPPHLHFDACRRALAAGGHVICEKPLVSSLRDADALAALCTRTGRALFPVFQYRFGPGAARLRALLDAGIAGRPYVATLETHWCRDKAYYQPAWRGTWAGEQGGAVLGHAIHIHDWLSFALGPVASVYAELATRVNAIDVEDCAALTIRMQSGALVSSSVTLGAADDTSRLRFCFAGLTAESGRLPYAPADGVWTFTARAPVEQRAIDALLAAVAVPRSGYAGLFAAIADALDGNGGRGREAVTLADGRRSLEFVSAVYASARSGVPVALPLDRTHPLYHGWAPR